MDIRAAPLSTATLAFALIAGGPARASGQGPVEPVESTPASSPVQVADPFAGSPSTVPAGAVRSPPGVVPPAGPPAPTAASGPAAQVWEAERPDTPAPG